MIRTSLVIAALSLAACGPTAQAPAPQSLAGAIHQATTSNEDLADEAAEKAADEARDEKQGQTYEAIFGSAGCTDNSNGAALTIEALELLAKAEAKNA